jgi:starch synthase
MHRCNVVRAKCFNSGWGREMKVLLVASEMYPLAKVGGLADVISILPKKLKNLDCDVRVILPYYKRVKRSLSELGVAAKYLDNIITVDVGGREYIGNVKEIHLGGIPVYLLVNDALYNRDYIYCTPEGDYKDNDERFGFLSLGALEVARKVGFRPDIIHCHDWITSLLPISLKWRKGLKDDHYFKKSKTILTIHNISYQGLYDEGLLDKFDLPPSLFTFENLEFYGKVNLLKGGILYSDVVTTVSPSYAEELQTPEYGCGLDGVLRSISHEKGRLVGILNEIDYATWDPKKDNYIYSKDSQDPLDYKLRNKLGVKLDLGLNLDMNKPLIGMVTRLTEQKGVDLVIESLKQIIELGFQLVITGRGEQRYEQMLRTAQHELKDDFAIVINPDDFAVRRIYAGSDIFLMPSRFEPCGLSQMIALRYGSIPVVRGTGGLLDTIHDYKLSKDGGNGFLFYNFSKFDLLSALARVKYLYDKRTEWQRLVRRAMGRQFFWKQSSNVYFDLYNQLINGGSNHHVSKISALSA